MAAREEDKAMAGLLRRSLARDSGEGSAENCPEPEILAAYFDHALDAEETAHYDLHFSRCSLCREQLAAMARAGGVGDSDGVERKTASAWAWLASHGWLMPAAVMLVALLAITGIALRMRKPVVPANQVAMARPEVAPQSNPTPLTNSAPPPEAAPLSAAALSAPRAMDSIALPPSAPSGSRADAVRAPVVPTESSASRQLGSRSPSHTVSHANSAPRTGELSRVAVVGGAVSGSGSGVAGGTVNSADQTVTVTEPGPPQDGADAAKLIQEKEEQDSVKKGAAASVEVEAAPQPNERKTRSSATTSSAGRAGAAAPAPSAKAMNLAASKATEAAALAKMQQAQISSNLMNLQIQTPDPKILWMIAGAGAIEKSEDGGTTWQLQYPASSAQILAGSAPGAKICWLVGANGTILRTTNGAHWKTIKPPVDTDFARVEATDELTATVTALDGRRFSTSDGGKSWSGVK